MYLFDKLIKSHIMGNNIQLFKNEQFGEIRVAELNNEPIFCLKDLCNALDLKNNRKVASQLDEDVTLSYPLETPGGVQQATFVTEAGMYTVILRSDSQKAKPLQKWVTGEILPSIRKTGGYIATSENDTPEMIMARAIILAQETIKKKEEKLKQLEQRNKILEPKADFADVAFKAVDSMVDIGQAAKILNLGFGRNTLFKKLKEIGVFFSNRNEPKQEYIKRGYFVMTELPPIERNNHSPLIVMKVLVTQKGLAYINQLFGKKQAELKLAKIM